MNKDSKTPIFVGNGKRAKTERVIVNISLCLTDVPKVFIKQATNGKEYLALKLVKKETEDKFGNTHYLCIDDFVPTAKKETKSKYKNEE